jgi:LmbE family N-acetylglucosaminyl deacetylase
VSTVVFLHAHPDDEATLTAGTMARLSDAGDRVVLVTATRGELGELPEGGLAEGETLADRRVAELAEADRILGVQRQVFLDYLDSGMDGEPANGRPGCFATADLGEAAARLAAVLVEEHADVLVTYDEHGNYGHPDHVQVHRVGMAAADLAGTPVVYLATTDRDAMASLAEQAAADGLLPEDQAPEDMASMGEPHRRLTTIEDVTPWIARKRATMRAHPSQITESSFFLALPDEVFAQVFGREWYIRVRPPVSGDYDGPFEDALATSVGVLR